MTLRRLENEIAKDWIKEQNINWRFTKNFRYKDLGITFQPNRVKIITVINWELSKCQGLNLITKEQSENLITMLNSKNESDVDLGRRLLANVRKQRLKL